MFCFLLLFFIQKAVQAEGTVTTDFIRSYVEYERKPTTLYCNYLCWKKDRQINMFKVLARSAIRVSSAFDSDATRNHHHILFLVDLSCHQLDDFTNVTEYFRSPYRWLVLRDANDSDHHQYLWDLPLPLDSDFVVAERSRDMFTLTELYKPSLLGATHSVSRGYFNGLIYDSRGEKELFRRRKDAMSHPLIMSNVILDSNTSKYHLPREDRLLLQYDAAAKLNWIAVRTVAQMINATPKYIFSYSYGYKNNGQWSGMIRDLEIKKADLGTNCIPNPDRVDVAVFTDSIAPIKVKFILRQPPLSYVSNIFTLPFAMNVWAAIILFVCVSSTAVYFANKWEASTSLHRTPDSISDAVFFTISSLSQQSTTNEPRRIAGRIILWLIFIAMMALYTAYCANIVVLLQAPSTAIKTLEQLRNSKITISALDVNYNHFVLKAQKDPIRRDIYKRIVPDIGKTQYCRLNDCIEKLRKGLFAFHVILEPVYRRIEETFLETEKCDLIEIDYVNGVDTFVPVRKDLPYLEILRVAFKRVREAGVLAGLQKRLIMTKPKCTNRTAFTSVGLVNLRPVIILMICGFAASIITWIGEVIVYKITRRRRRLQFSKNNCY